MSLTMHQLQQIYAALDREPGWKRALLEESTEAFRQWLSRVHPDVADQIQESLWDAFSRVIG
jgi:hypothetical protein